jgi:hypothetical protein
MPSSASHSCNTAKNGEEPRHRGPRVEHERCSVRHHGRADRVTIERVVKCGHDHGVTGEVLRQGARCPVRDRTLRELLEQRCSHARPVVDPRELVEQRLAIPAVEGV